MIYLFYFHFIIKIRENALTSISCRLGEFFKYFTHFQSEFNLAEYNLEF